MKLPPLNVGILNPPDAHYKPVLYSDAKASQDFSKLETDIYNSVKKSRKINERKTPKSVFVSLGAIGATLCFFIIKKLIKH